MTYNGNPKVQSNELNKEMVPDQGTQSTDSSVSTAQNGSSAEQLVISAGDNSAHVNPPMDQNSSTKKEVEGDVSSQTIAEIDFPRRLPTDVDALFKALKKENFTLGNEEEEKRLREAFKRATDFSSLVKGLSISQAQLCLNVFEYKEISQYININIIQSGYEAVEEADDLIAKYFKDYKGYLAYCEKNSDSDGLDTLHISLGQHIMVPTKISDVLQQEKHIGALKIYRGPNEEIVASRGKKDDINIRNYEFKRDVNYDMTINWEAQDGDQDVKLEMVVSVNHEGITALRNCYKDGTEITDTDGKDAFFKQFAKQNKELYINGLPLCEEFELPVIGKSSETVICNDTATQGVDSTPKQPDGAQNNAATQGVDSTPKQPDGAQNNAATQGVDSTPKQPDGAQNNAATQGVDSTPKQPDGAQSDATNDVPNTVLGDIPGVHQHSSVGKGLSK